jgi:D-sedoheptulose 7-phosphate isomerase
MSTIETHLTAHREALIYFEGHSTGVVEDIAELLINCFESGGTVYICGNGGSAADAQHLSGEFVGRFKRERKPLPAVALSTDTSVITCISNDYSYDQIFARQVEALMNSKDVLWAFSTSGSSANVIAAAEEARNSGSKIVGFTGKTNSRLEELSDLCLCSHTDATGTAQEIHQIAYHMICEIIDQRFSN